MAQLDPTVSRDPARTPERALVAAIIAQSVDDLTHPDPGIRSSARAFWTARFGRSAALRYEYLSLLDIDDTVARSRIRHLLDDSAVREQKEKTFQSRPLYLQLLDALPEGEFTVKNLDDFDHGLEAASLCSAFQTLKDKNLIRRTVQKRNGALWARTDSPQASENAA